MPDSLKDLNTSSPYGAGVCWRSYFFNRNLHLPHKKDEAISEGK